MYFLCERAPRYGCIIIGLVALILLGCGSVTNCNRYEKNPKSKFYFSILKQRYICFYLKQMYASLRFYSLYEKCYIKYCHFGISKY